MDVLDLLKRETDAVLFRQQKYAEQNGRCPICGMKLGKTANLHHLNLSFENYTDLSKPENFVFLCNTCYDCIHFKYIQI